MLLTFAVRETASLGIMGAPRVPPLNPSESIVLWMPRDASRSNSCEFFVSFFPPVPNINILLLLLDDNKVKVGRNPGKKQKENPVWYTGEGNR